MFPNINAEMARNSMTNKKMADKLGVSEKTVTNWKTGKTEIPASKLLEMSRMFGVSTDYLLGVRTA